MAFHICSVIYKTDLSEETMSEKVKDVLDVFAATHVYEITPGKSSAGYTVETLIGEQAGFVTIYPQLIQFYMYVEGGSPTLAEAHALEADMKKLMETVFGDYERSPVSLLAPLP